MEEQILQLLTQDNRAFSVYEINDGLGLKTVDDLKELLKVLNSMEDNLKVYRTKHDKYMLFHDSNLKIGIMIANKKGFGFVDIEGDEDVFIAPPNMNYAIHGDKVVVEITSKKGYGLEGRVVRIMKRELEQMVGEFYTKDGKGYIDLDDEKVKINVQIDADKTMGAMDGHKVLVKVTNKLKDNNYRGEIVRILGHKNDPGVDILSIATKFNIEDTFPEEVMVEVEAIPEHVSEVEMKDRRDLREKLIFTIDGADTKDIDDAISLEMLENGNYLLGVHIADVSYYVRPNTKLDDDAYLRGTSVYLADRVIPMLPHKLSNGICSLNEGENRLAISCEMEIDAKGNTVSSDIYESVIRSHKKMTYTEVNQLLEKGITPAGYDPYRDTLLHMKDLASILRDMKEKRGYIDFEIDESKIIVNEIGEAIDVVLRERGIGEKLIEDFMIAANEAVATQIYFMELPFIYRVHGTPNEEKIQSFLKFISVLGYQLNGKIHNITPKVMQEILSQLHDKKEFHILSAMLLRSMQKAVYDKTNIGHFGLASKYYTHFTSPIRRYPDTTVHRLLRTYLFNHQLDHDTIEYWERKLIPLSEHVSKAEQSSIECEREVDDMKKAEFMMKHIGESFLGIVSSVMSFGMFIELPNLVEGLLRVENLKGDYYTFDEATFSLIGKKNKRGYRLGDTVEVVVTAANKENRTVDFMLKTDYEKQTVKIEEVK